MSSPLLSSSAPSTSSASVPAPSISNSVEEENADEVKIFRTEVDDTNDEPLDDELVADKTDVAFEADTDLGERSAFSSAQLSSGGLFDNAGIAAARQQALEVLARMAFPSPGYILPFLQPPFSPLSPLYAAQHAANLANMVRNSPSHAAAANLYAAALSGGAFGAGVNPFGAFGAPPVLQPLPGGGPVAGGAFGHGRLPPSTPTRLGAGVSAMNSPVSSMSAGLNGMSLLERSAHHRSAYKSAHTTPKRSGAPTPYGLQSAPGSATIGHKTSKQDRGSGGEREEKPVHIKKPCNAFMWYMKMNRKRLLAEQGGQQVQSATINRRLGEEWQNLSKEEQQKYFQLASKEREEHQKLHPDWTARDNYAIKKNKKKKSREKSSENNDQKKCRARFGVENQAKWCKHCKRKKRCLNVRDAESPVHVVSSTTPGHLLPGGSAMRHGVGAAKSMLDGLQRHVPASSGIAPLHALNAHAQMSSASSTASSSTASRHLDSPSSSGIMSVGKRTESNASSNFDGTSPPPPGSSSSSAASQHAAANNPLGLLQSLQHHPQFTQFASALANCATPKAEPHVASANATPLAPSSTSSAMRDDVEMPKPTHLVSQFHQQQQQQQYHQQHQQLFNNFNFNPMDPNHSFMAYAAAAAFTPQNLK